MEERWKGVWSQTYVWWKEQYDMQDSKTDTRFTWKSRRYQVHNQWKENRSKTIIIAIKFSSDKPLKIAGSDRIMVSWFKTVIIGLIIAVVGGTVAIFTSSNPNTTNYSQVSWGVCIIGVGLIIVGFVTKAKHLKRF